MQLAPSLPISLLERTKVCRASLQRSKSAIAPAPSLVMLLWDRLRDSSSKSGWEQES